MWERWPSVEDCKSHPGEMRFIESETHPLLKCKAHLWGTVEVICHVEIEQRIQIVKGSSLFVDVPS